MNAEKEEAVVRALYAQLMDGWNEGIAEAFAAPFEEDADFIAFDGTHHNGRDPVWMPRAGRGSPIRPPRG